LLVLVTLGGVTLHGSTALLRGFEARIISVRAAASWSSAHEALADTLLRVRPPFWARDFSVEYYGGSGAQTLTANYVDGDPHAVSVVRTTETALFLEQRRLDTETRDRIRARAPAPAPVLSRRFSLSGVHLTPLRRSDGSCYGVELRCTRAVAGDGPKSLTFPFGGVPRAR
jgi:hypothetical protein